MIHTTLFVSFYLQTVSLIQSIGIIISPTVVKLKLMMGNPGKCLFLTEVSYHDWTKI